MIFASTPPISDDPKPLRVVMSEGMRVKGPTRFAVDSPFMYSNAEYKFDPRPEFDRPRAHEVNPILISFRSVAARSAYVHQLIPITAFSWLREGDFPGYWPKATPEQIDHARRVLIRLANFS